MFPLLINDNLAAQVSRGPKRFAVFCCLSIHDEQQSTDKLTRCIQEYGKARAMLNDLHRPQRIYYDGPRFGTYWTMAQQLDLVVYINPRFTHPAVIENLFGGRMRFWKNIRFGIISKLDTSFSF